VRVASGAVAENTYEDEPLTHFLVVKGIAVPAVVHALSLYVVTEMMPEVSAVYMEDDVEDVILHTFNWTYCIYVGMPEQVVSVVA